MVLKELEKDRALKMRRRGLSYREILRSVPVAKSTLSLWLRSVGLSKRQKQALTHKRIEASLRGAAKRHEQRLQTIEKITKSAFEDIEEISRRELWWIGIALYWAEGSKEKEKYPGSGINFNNSDPYMMKVFLKWLTEIAGVSKEDIGFEVYLHENSKNSIPVVVEYWSKVTGFPLSKFSKVYFKKNKVRTNRGNTGVSYFGLLRIKVRASSSLNRKIAGWIKGIQKYYWGVTA